MIWPFSHKKDKVDANNSQSSAPQQMECNDDPDCPMCHVSDEIVKQLQEGESGDKGEEVKK